MTQVALDSSALAAWVLREPRWQVIDEVLRRADSVVLPGPVLIEVIDVARRRGNRATPQQLADAIRAQGAVVVHPVDADLVRAAELAERGRLGAAGAAGGSLSLGDTMILAICERLGCPVVTRDRLWRDLHAAGLLPVDVVDF